MIRRPLWRLAFTSNAARQELAVRVNRPILHAADVRKGRTVGIASVKGALARPLLFCDEIVAQLVVADVDSFGSERSRTV